MSSQNEISGSQPESPIHLRAVLPNPQNSSPLYSRLPAETRNQIFSLVLTEQEATNYLLIYPQTFNRPGYRAKRLFNANLLQTCRMIYYEAYHIPFSSKEHVFWHAPDTGPPIRHGRYDPFGHEMEDRYFGRLQLWQVMLVKEVHLFTQMFWLEQSFSRLCTQRYMQGIVKLKITIRKTDWWWNEKNVSLAINPQRGTGGGDNHPSQMIGDMAAFKTDGEVEPWNMAGWGGAFALLGSLEQLEMHFEAAGDKRGELTALVEWAKSWRFPLTEGRVLSTGSCEPSIVSWDGPECFWSMWCPSCYGFGECRPIDDSTEAAPPTCVDRTRRKSLRLGPLCHIYGLRWTVTKDVESEV